MKRHKHLSEQVTTFENLLLAARKARKGAVSKRECQAFFFRLEPELLALQQALVEETYEPALYRYFQIYDPKERTISVAPFCDRVVHHAVINILEPIYERRFIYDSYATRKEKGTHAAIARSQRFVRRYRWYFKTDIDKYFDSIDHQVLLQLLAGKVGDTSLLSLLEKIIRNGGKDGKGLPIGNLTSQFFANVYLDPFDHFVKEHLRCRAYLRYMDDFVLFSEDKDELKAWREAVKSYLADHLFLRLKPSATFLNQRSNGLGFLGARIFPDLIRIKAESGRRVNKRMRIKRHQFETGKVTQEQYLNSMASYWGYLKSFDSLELRKASLSYQPEL